MNREGLLKLYDRLTRLVEKLPGGLQKPILRELVPLRQIFLEQRPARILVLGDPGRDACEVLCGGPLEPGLIDNEWRIYGSPERGAVAILDLRGAGDLPGHALARMAPDLVLLVASAAAPESTVSGAADRLAGLAAEVPVIALAEGDEASRLRLLAGVKTSRLLSARRHIVLRAGDDIADAVCEFLPNTARLEFARVSGAKAAQARLAGSLLKSFTAICGLIGLQPIPLADMPILTTLQAFMVGLIIYVSGKPAGFRLGGEFLGAMGLNIGAGMVFREGARAIVKVVPIWGNAVSGLVAGAGTYAIGRAAIAYFIEDIPLTETRKLFRRLLPGLNSFRQKRLALPWSKKTPPPLPKD